MNLYLLNLYFMIPQLFFLMIFIFTFTFIWRRPISLMPQSKFIMMTFLMLTLCPIFRSWFYLINVHLFICFLTIRWWNASFVIYSMGQLLNFLFLFLYLFFVLVHLMLGRFKQFLRHLIDKIRSLSIRLHNWIPWNWHNTLDKVCLWILSHHIIALFILLNSKLLVILLITIIEIILQYVAHIATLSPFFKLFQWNVYPIHIAFNELLKVLYLRLCSLYEIYSLF